MKTLEGRETVLTQNEKISGEAENRLFSESGIFEAIEEVRKIEQYKDLKWSLREITEGERENIRVSGIIVGLSWDINNNHHKTAKIRIYPDGLLEFGWGTKTFYGWGTLDKQTREAVPNKIFDKLMKLLRHSPTTPHSPI